ncbi:hypothetical protein EK21DRAFT_91383 [Setomelanomma holmii]|uniref:Arrestin-like N-terminal domain-containing protein n=1 Tax=Setomelanomma holmii TaxID=210430 RepID=A0A9P4H6K3_9PLEO|nr:hypothetical protein EK21DRAFT_91383 [Setomelanomma holmii]
MALTGALVNLKERPLYICFVEETRPFYTCGDRVRGVVRVEPTLRPKRIIIIFKGYSVVHDANANGISAAFFSYKKDLFVSSGAHENFEILRQGTASDGKVELPFEFSFPTNVDIPPPSDTGRTWWYPKDSYDHPRFQHSLGFVLPPSCGSLTFSNSPLAPRITYVLEACLDSTNPDNPHMKVRQELKFVPPAPEYDLALVQPNLDFGTKLPKHCCRYKFIRTRKLLPGYAESSKLGKIRDVLVEKELFFGLESFAEIPFARFNLLATPARVLVIGSDIPMSLTVQHLDRSASLPTPPELFMRRIRVQLLPAFHIFIPRLAQGGHAKETLEVARDTWTLLDTRFDEANPKRLQDGFTLSDIGVVPLVHEKLLPSFTSYGLALEYEIQVEIWGECATREFSGIVCRDQIQVVAGWNATPPQIEFEESQVALAELESGPAYEEVDPMASLRRTDIQAPSYEFHTPLPTQQPDFQAATQPLMARQQPPPYMA